LTLSDDLPTHVVIHPVQLAYYLHPSDVLQSPSTGHPAHHSILQTIVSWAQLPKLVSAPVNILALTQSLTRKMTAVMALVVCLQRLPSLERPFIHRVIIISSLLMISRWLMITMN
jgi:hypothetical protein